MIIRGINLVLLIMVMLSAFHLISLRYSSRMDYATLSQAQILGEKLNQEYTRLQLEVGTYSSNLVLKEFAQNKFGLVNPDSQHIVEMKENVSK